MASACAMQPPCGRNRDARWTRRRSTGACHLCRPSLLGGALCRQRIRGRAGPRQARRRGAPGDGGARASSRRRAHGLLPPGRRWRTWCTSESRNRSSDNRILESGGLSNQPGTLVRRLVRLSGMGPQGLSAPDPISFSSAPRTTSSRSTTGSAKAPSVVLCGRYTAVGAREFPAWPLTWASRLDVTRERPYIRRWSSSSTPRRTSSSSVERAQRRRAMKRTRSRTPRSPRISPRGPASSLSSPGVMGAFRSAWSHSPRSRPRTSTATTTSSTLRWTARGPIADPGRLNRGARAAGRPNRDEPCPDRLGRDCEGRPRPWGGAPRATDDPGLARRIHGPTGDSLVRRLAPAGCTDESGTGSARSLARRSTTAV